MCNGLVSRHSKWLRSGGTEDLLRRLCAATSGVHFQCFPFLILFPFFFFVNASCSASVCSHPSFSGLHTFLLIGHEAQRLNTHIRWSTRFNHISSSSPQRRDCATTALRSPRRLGARFLFMSSPSCRCPHLTLYAPSPSSTTGLHRGRAPWVFGHPPVIPPTLYSFVVLPHLALCALSPSSMLLANSTPVNSTR